MHLLNSVVDELHTPPLWLSFVVTFGTIYKCLGLLT